MANVLVVLGAAFVLEGIALAGTGRAAGDPLAEDLLTALDPLVGLLSAVIWTTSLLTNANRRLTHVVGSQTDLLASFLLLDEEGRYTKGLFTRRATRPSSSAQRTPRLS